ncbi:MAG: hypothetical protein ABIH26_03500 [Candidatus Eisenbacteria bacterium]
MKRGAVGALLWLFLLPLLGVPSLLRGFVRILGQLPGRIVFSLVGLMVLWSTPNPLTEQFTFEAFRPIGLLALPIGLPVFGLLALYLGQRSPTGRRLRRRFR